ncbi:hypothetical protein F4810DRAFT_37779 [Camillea tinctor]|nr:hypothetical protein F4810DRAFT_37779 [Camillea tinctor]
MAKMNPLTPVFVPRSTVDRSTTVPGYKLNPLAAQFIPKSLRIPQVDGGLGKHTFDPLSPVFRPAFQESPIYGLTPQNHSDATATTTVTSTVTRTVDDDYADRELPKLVVCEYSFEQIYTYEWLRSRGFPENSCRFHAGWSTNPFEPIVPLPKYALAVPSLEGLSHQEKMLELGKLRDARFAHEITRDRAKQEANEAECKRVITEVLADLQLQVEQRQRQEDEDEEL